MTNPTCCNNHKTEAETIACIHRACPCAMRSSQFVIHQGCLLLATTASSSYPYCGNPCTPPAIRILTSNEIQLLNEAKMRQERKRLKQIRKEASLSMERHAQDIRIQEAAKQFKNQRKKYERERINAAREMMQNYNPANSQYKQGFSDGRASVYSTSRDTEMSGEKAVAAFLICGLFIGIFVFLGILGFATLLI